MKKYSQNLPKTQEFETALIKSIQPGKRVYPNSFNRRFGTDIENTILVFNELVDDDVLQLRFVLKIDNELKNKVYKYKDLPKTYYDDEKCETIELDPLVNYEPIYEVKTL